jgi:uncharacterized protein (DUF849 family)
MDKLILTAALTGAITVPTQTAHLPYTIEGVADDAIACVKAGATAVHIHGRDPVDGRPSSDPAIVRAIVSRIKAGCDAVIGISTGGGMGMTPQQRLEGAALCQPELASFNLGSINFSMHPVARRFEKGEWKFGWEEPYVDGTRDFIFRNTFGDMEVFARMLKAKHVKPEFEAYDVGHLHNLKFLEKEGLVAPPYWIQFVLGVLGGAAADVETLLMMKQTADRLLGAENYRWSVIGVGYPMQFNMAAMGIIMGGNVRVGLEDNFYLETGRMACSNGELVEKAARMIRDQGRTPATVDECRQRLGLVNR